MKTQKQKQKIFAIVIIQTSSPASDQNQPVDYSATI